jgi:hypothetical protein
MCNLSKLIKIYEIIWTPFSYGAISPYVSTNSNIKVFEMKHEHANLNSIFCSGRLLTILKRQQQRRPCLAAV